MLIEFSYTFVYTKDENTKADSLRNSKFGQKKTWRLESFFETYITYVFCKINFWLKWQMMRQKALFFFQYITFFGLPKTIYWWFYCFLCCLFFLNGWQMTLWGWNRAFFLNGFMCCLEHIIEEKKNQNFWYFQIQNWLKYGWNMAFWRLTLLI